MGDVSDVVPSIRPWLAIVSKGEALCHEHRFAEAAATDAADLTLVMAAKALARTAIEFLADPELRQSVKREWDGGRGLRFAAFAHAAESRPQARGPPPPWASPQNSHPIP